LWLAELLLHCVGEKAVVGIPLNAQKLVAAHEPYNLALAQGLEMVPDTIVGESGGLMIDSLTAI
jgi:hypothetical protein